MNGAQWILPAPRPEAEALSRTLGIPPAIARVLAGRGVVDADQARAFLFGTEADLHDPLLMSGMRTAVERIRKAISRGERILVFGDYDVDGVLSVVMVLKALRKLGAKIEHYIPDRIREGYGLRERHLEVAAGKGASLVISVDCGIKSHEFVRRAGDKGIDVIVTDHHLPGETLPRAAAVLDPMRRDETYPYKFLAGVGVVFKLIQALFDGQEESNGLSHYLKLVAIGTIADVVELRGENRQMVRSGLKSLERVSNAGLKSLIEVARLRKGRVSAGDVGFRLGPRLNAAGRLANAELAVRLFMTDSPSEARDIACQLDEWNERRRRAEERILKDALEKVNAGGLDRAHKVLILGSDAWHKGVVGIVASKLKDLFHRPVVLFSCADGVASGSGRSIREFSLIECLDSCRDLFLSYGGHRLAAGCTLPVDRMDDFKSAVNGRAESLLSESDLRRKIVLDAALGLDELDEKFLEAYALLSPFGVGNPTPLFLTSGATVAGSVRKLKDKHVKFLVRHGDRVVEAIGWDRAAWADGLRPGERLDLAWTLQTSSYLGTESVHLSLQDWRRAS